MTASQFVARIRKNGGRVWLDEVNRLNADGASNCEMAELAKSYDLVVALLREEIAGRRWESCGRDSRWWRRPEQSWNYPDQTPKPLPELVRVWVDERTVASAQCCTRVSALYGNFVTWSGLEPNAVVEQEFLRQMEILDYPQREGWVTGICLAEDFVAAVPDKNRGDACFDADESEKRMPSVA